MSSPRQKMAVVASPQPNELEQRKKRQTLERARANHLSKQLQMRLQYAKLKVEHGWQRQNLNEVENLYFHHSHLRNMRHSTAQRPHYPVTTPPGVTLSAEIPVVQSPAPSGIPDTTLGPSSSANDAPPSGSVSPPSQPPPEHAFNSDGRPAVQTLIPTAPATNRPPHALDLSDPNILARLAQLQAQVHSSQSQSQPQVPAQPHALSRHSSTTLILPPASTPTSQLTTVPGLVPVPLPAPTSAPSAFTSHILPPTTHPQPIFSLPAFAPQLLGVPIPGSAPFYPIPASAPHNGPAAPPQLPVATSASVSTPTVGPMLTPTPIPPPALTYDSFWSTHASSAGPTRALYRTHTGFSASAAPGGNVAMLTPGGHAAIMTAEGLYVGGGSK